MRATSVREAYWVAQGGGRALAEGVLAGQGRRGRTYSSRYGGCSGRGTE